MEERELVKSVTINEFAGVVDVYRVNNKYFSVEYRGKEEYYTTNEEISNEVSVAILVYYRDLSLGSGILNRDIAEEDKWRNVISFLSNESKKPVVGKEISRVLYQSFESSYYDQLDNVDNVDVKTLSMKSVIRNKDNLIDAIHKITSQKNKIEADKNLARYRRIRNDFVSKNPQLNLGVL